MHACMQLCMHGRTRACMYGESITLTNCRIMRCASACPTAESNAMDWKDESMDSIKTPRYRKLLAINQCKVIEWRCSSSDLLSLFSSL